jgi:hypothetical protein
MRKGLVAVGAVVVLLVGAAGADRAAAGAAERAITDAVRQEVAGARDVTAQVHGIPLLTQVAAGSLDHVTVTMSGVSPSEGVTLDDVVVDLRGVTTSEPRTADVVDARALVPTSTLQAKLGTAWTVVPEGPLLLVTSASLPVEVRVTPVVQDGAVRFDIDTVTLLGIVVQGDSIPQAVTERITSLVVPTTDLPFDLAVTTVTVVPDGVTVAATGTDVPLATT